MTTATSALGAFRSAREARRERTTAPLLITLAVFLGRHLPSWRRFRTATLSIGGFAFLDLAAWNLHYVAGLAAIGLSLLVLEALGSDRERSYR